MTTYALLWSQRQNAAHVEPLDAALSARRRAYAEDRATDYVLLLTGTAEEMQRAAENMAPTLRVREQARAAIRRAAA